MIKTILFPIALVAITIISANNSRACDTHNHFNPVPAYYTQLNELVKNTQQVRTTAGFKNILIQIAAVLMHVNKDTCKEPKESDLKSFCTDISSKTRASGSKTDTVEYRYEQRLWEVACAVMGVDDLETAKIKIQTWWNKYKTKCKCDSLGFNIPNGNLLKFSVSQSMPDFIDTMVSTYGLDINFKDPADGKNVLDYVNDEIKRFKDTGVSQPSIKIYEDYRASLIKLGAKPSK